jgi:hypothetical protein
MFSLSSNSWWTHSMSGILLCKFFITYPVCGLCKSTKYVITLMNLTCTCTYVILGGNCITRLLSLFCILKIIKSFDPQIQELKPVRRHQDQGGSLISPLAFINAYMPASWETVLTGMHVGSLMCMHPRWGEGDFIGLQPPGWQTIFLLYSIWNSKQQKM